MIKAYRDKKTRAFSRGEIVKDFQSFRFQAEERLEILDVAQSLADLTALPGNRFEAPFWKKTGSV